MNCSLEGYLFVPLLSKPEKSLMAMRPLLALAFVLAVLVPGSLMHPQSAEDRQPTSDHNPVLTNACLITNDVSRLVAFYEPALGLRARWSGKDYAEFQTGRGVLAIFSAEVQDKYIPESAEAAKNKSLVLEFEVTDVDREYRRLERLVRTWVKPPTTQPWGTRSVYFRDPDGNLVDFYTTPKAHE
jgi:catechol 2,3-dioxygenase-like lactoylglutathione lyase family enzyme